MKREVERRISPLNNTWKQIKESERLVKRLGLWLASGPTPLFNGRQANKWFNFLPRTSVLPGWTRTPRRMTALWGG